MRGRTGSGGRRRGIGAEVSSPYRSLVPAIGEQNIGDDAMSDHRSRSRLREYDKEEIAAPVTAKIRKPARRASLRRARARTDRRKSEETSEDAWV
jgi:hypothetical protein